MTDYFAAAHIAQTKHGHAKRGAWSKTYRAWRYMRDRVARDPDYAHVHIDPRWHSYEAFFSDMGEQPIGKTLDRIDNNLPYGPKNCRWATTLEQANNKSSNRYITHGGVTRTISEWARFLGMNMHTLHNRIYSCGWSDEKALTTPVRK